MTNTPKDGGAAMDPQFTGDDLTRLVVDVEAAVGTNLAGLTPLGIAVGSICEEAIKADALRGEK